MRKVVPPVYLLGALIFMACLHRWLPVAQLIEPPFSYAGAVVIAIGTQFIRHEERLLDKTLSEPYLAYKAKVRRWL